MNPNTERQRKFRKARKKAGWYRLECYIRNSYVKLVKEFIANLHKGDK